MNKLMEKRKKVKYGKFVTQTMNNICLLSSSVLLVCL